MTLGLGSIVRPRHMSRHPLKECVSRHNVLSVSRTNVRPQRSCGSLYTLMCSFVSSNTLVLCTVEWLQDGCARMTECGNFLGQPLHRRLIVVSQSRFSALNLSTNDHVDLTVKLSGPFPETIKTPTFPVSMSTIVSTVALACASGHQTATPEMN